MQPCFETSEVFFEKNPSDKQEVSPKQTEEEWRKVIKIHKFSDRELKKQSNFPITLTPSTAKLEYIANVIFCRIV